MHSDSASNVTPRLSFSLIFYITTLFHDVQHIFIYIICQVGGIGHLDQIL
ncbi:hypothetical protein RchiOBHm_Chr6g0260981 [Rosa chinensis]|uniref:Uncharacterized protein n=1 Tax=Rosa chinensis TaxID=74649 RepID=A0A2P6PN96_ROSCH|nr:hypothetical protein RchiOBHm_Chr6g0260981 [Rosa chinensis]